MIHELRDSVLECGSPLALLKTARLHFSFDFLD
jgi:hypothetical protein